MNTIRVSIGTASVLGLTRAPMAVAPTTAYFMLGGRCTMNCAFCAQARSSQANEEALSRVTWPEFPLSQVIESLEHAVAQGKFRRCCIQMTAGRSAYQELVAAIKALRKVSDLPLDAAYLPANIDQVAELMSYGIDHLGYGLDAASERVFHIVKGKHWAHVTQLIEQSAQQFPGHVAVHLIVGLGETELEMVQRIDWAYQLGCSVGLFAFTPLRGTPLALKPQPPLSQYRRMQLVRWLICERDAAWSDFEFDAHGTLTGILISGWQDLVCHGDPFRTSGCSDCNRPFYNERPSGPMYNYPRPLTSQEAAVAVQEAENLV